VIEETGVSEEALRRSKEAFLRRKELEKMGISGEALRRSKEASPQRLSDRSDEFYRTKLEDVARLRAERELGSSGPKYEGPYTYARGVSPLEVTPIPGKPARSIYPREGLPIEPTPATWRAPGTGLVARFLNPTSPISSVLVPEGGPGGALDSGAAFRKKSEELGARYLEAKRARAAGDEEIEQALKNPATSRSTDLPRLAAAQRQRTQQYVTAREALRQMGFVGKEGMTAEQEMDKTFGY
jgi:hypothetical protein